MTSSITRADGLARARYLRIASHVVLGIWVLGWVLFAVLVGVRADTNLVSAVAALICILFAISCALQALSRRVAWRELVHLAARDDLSATRSRGITRVR
jgi:lysylphosphatidylglycerol synthetase-like protein (DUF2156 family)